MQRGFPKSGSRVSDERGGRSKQGSKKRGSHTLTSLEPKQLCAIIISAAVDQPVLLFPGRKEEPAINKRIISQ